LLLGILFAVGIYLLVRSDASRQTPQADGTKEALPIAKTNKASTPATVKLPQAQYVLKQTCVEADLDRT
jgi:hypothetical protein